jgi:RNA polymerase sigma-70 factor (ECF subfamily)
MDLAAAQPVPPWVLRIAAALGLLRAVPLSPSAGDVDRLVLARARRGDHQAFAQIVDHYDHRLRGLAYRLLDDRDRMDDVLQEAYVKAFRSLPRFKGESALGTWLYRIVYNACIDDLRSRKATVPLDDGLDMPDRRPDPADVAIGRRDLAAALATLPPDQKAAVLLVDAYGLDYAEAADALGVATGTIGSRLTRARTSLRTFLEADGGPR